MLDIDNINEMIEKKGKVVSLDDWDDFLKCYESVEDLEDDHEPCSISTQNEVKDVQNGKDVKDGHTKKEIEDGQTEKDVKEQSNNDSETGVLSGHVDNNHNESEEENHDNDSSPDEVESDQGVVTRNPYISHLLRLWNDGTVADSSSSTSLPSSSTSSQDDLSRGTTVEVQNTVRDREVPDIDSFDEFEHFVAEDETRTLNSSCVNISLDHVVPTNYYEE